MMWLITVSGLLVVCLASVRAECEMDGNVYQTGDRIRIDVCTTCVCQEDGDTICSPLMCHPPPCVDSVQDPDKCCPYCPNGPNCPGLDGSIINAGELKVMEDGSTCVCGEGPFSGYQSPFCPMPMPPTPPTPSMPSMPPTPPTPPIPA